MAASAAGSLLNLAQRSLDRVFPPRSREQAYTRIQEFATARPLLFTFLLTQTLLTLPPILLFTTFALSTLLFTLLLAAATTLFLAGAALLFLLLPALCAASAVALCAWAWAVAAFLFGRWALRAVVLRPQQQQQPAPAPASAPALAPALAPSSPASAATPSSAPPSGSAPAVVGTEDKEGERGGDGREGDRGDAGGKEGEEKEEKGAQDEQRLPNVSVTACGVGPSRGEGATAVEDEGEGVRGRE